MIATDTTATATIGKGKAVHLYYIHGELVHCGADKLVAGTATRTADNAAVTCKRCLAEVVKRVERDHAEALEIDAKLVQIGRLERHGSVEARLAAYDVRDEILAAGFEAQAVSNVPAASGAVSTTSCGRSWKVGTSRYTCDVRITWEQHQRGPADQPNVGPKHEGPCYDSIRRVWSDWTDPAPRAIQMMQLTHKRIETAFPISAEELAALRGFLCQPIGEIRKQLAEAGWAPPSAGGCACGHDERVHSLLGNGCRVASCPCAVFRPVERVSPNWSEPCAREPFGARCKVRCAGCCWR